jgi:hypothetical protein
MQDFQAELMDKKTVVSRVARYVEIGIDVIVHVFISVGLTVMIGGRQRLHSEDIRVSVVARS